MQTPLARPSDSSSIRLSGLIAGILADYPTKIVKEAITSLTRLPLLATIQAHERPVKLQSQISRQIVSRRSPRPSILELTSKSSTGEVHWKPI